MPASARSVQNGWSCRPAASAKNSVDCRSSAVCISRSRSSNKSSATPASPGSASAVCAATAASQPDARAFFTPQDDSGSMNEPASPTSSMPGAPYVCAW